MNNEENTVLSPRMVSVAPKEAHSGCGSGSRSDLTHSTTIAS